MIRERLLISEDDVPMRLCALALGEAPDARMSEFLGRIFAFGADEALARLKNAAERAGLVGGVVPSVATPDPLDGQLAGVHYLLVEGAPVTAAALAAAPDLRLIQKHGEDCRNIDLEAAAARRIPVAMLRRWANTSVAEHTFLLMLAVARRLVESHRAAAAPHPDATSRGSRYNWAGVGGSWSLRDKTLGIVGLGEIGRAVARRAQPFDMRILYTQRRRLPPELERALTTEFRSLPELLAESDVVTLQIPLNAETQHFLGEAELRRMRRGAVLINTSRGRLVDETALIRALRDGHLGGAGLDVLHDEPPASTEALACFPTVVLTPHVAAGTGTELLADVRAILDNIARVRRGEPVVGLVGDATR